MLPRRQLPDKLLASYLPASPLLVAGSAAPLSCKWNHVSASSTSSGPSCSSPVDLSGLIENGDMLLLLRAKRRLLGKVLPHHLPTSPLQVARYAASPVLPRAIVHVSPDVISSAACRRVSIPASLLLPGRGGGAFWKGSCQITLRHQNCRWQGAGGLLRSCPWEHAPASSVHKGELPFPPLQDKKQK